MRNGSDRFVRDAQHHAEDVNKLRKYKYFNQSNEDIAGDGQCQIRSRFYWCEAGSVEEGLSDVHYNSKIHHHLIPFNLNIT